MSGGVFTARRSSGFYPRVLLGLVVVAVLAPFFRGPRIIDLDAATYDPAIETELKARSHDFGGVDRWTYPGMQADFLVARLQASGYQCPAVQDPKVGGTPQAGVHQQTCVRHRGFPLARDLVVQATVDYSHARQMTAIKAYSVDLSRSALRGRYARLLRRLGLIEPAVLPVRGLSFDSSASLARHVVDSIKPNGWLNMCADSQDPVCGDVAKRRRDEGLPAIPAEPVSVSLLVLMRSLDLIGLTLAAGDQPVPRRSIDDPLPIRVDGDAHWLDFLGHDFTGAARRVSVQIEPAGAKPVGITVRQGSSPAETLALAGIPRNGDLQ
jgi:hypothetical protein